MDRKSYTVDTGVTLDNPAEQFGLLFVGWSDDNGELFTSIRPGMTGNKTLHANWTSMRNLSTSVAPTEEPLEIIEDAENGR